MWDDGVKRSMAERRRCEKYEAVTESRARTGKKRTPRLRSPVGTPGEKGVERPDGREPEAGDGAGLGSGGVTGKPFAESETNGHRKTCERNCVKSGFMSECARQAGKEGFAGDAC